MQITRSSIDTQKGPADWFTGDVYIDAVAAPAGTSTFAAALVHFTPGARTAWHTHPHGQTIFVTEGVGLCQREGGPIEEIRPGDRVFFEPGENHWHGAAPEPLHGPHRHAAERRVRQPGHLGRARHRRAVRRRPVRMNPTYDFSGQVALVTGAGAGMGLDTARAFAAAGAAVVLADVNEQALRAATDELTAAGHRALGVACDVADEDQVAALVDRTVAEFGRLDMAFNNAGIMLPLADAADEPAESFDRVTAINLRGVWACMKHELRQMRAQGSGAIVNCSSLGGLVGNPGRASYHATKHGVLGLTKSAALEYAPRGIRINAVCPGTIETPMVADMIANGELTVADAVAGQPIGRLGRGDEIAAAVLWLCSPGASLVVGVALPVDGGYTAR